MEPSGISSHHPHRQTRRSEYRDSRRSHRVAHTRQTRGSDNNESLILWPTRAQEYAHDGDKHGLVNSWLEDIETPQLQPIHNNEIPSEDPSFRTRSRHETTPWLRNPSPSKLLSDNHHNGQVFKASPRQRLRERKRPRDLVEGSSIRDLRDEQSPAPEQPPSRAALVATEPHRARSKERSQADSQGSVVSVISGAEARFTKKARHKTRSDRYEAMKDRKPRKPSKKKSKNSEEQGKTNKTKRGGDFSSAREMQPTVRPGLFDNGRTSKDQLPDLTFHEMHFLKRPAPQRPIHRDRERAKKRGERELEEVSAFFLHKGTAEAPGAPGRNHPRVSGSSSLDRATRGSSALSTDAPPQQSRAGEHYGHCSPGLDKESSRATYWTWSSSDSAPRRRVAQGTASREHVPAQNSTPSSSSNELQHKKTFDNEGVGYVERPRQDPSAKSRPKDISVTRDSLAMVSSDVCNLQPDISRQNIRIVRYHDRGVMASDGDEIVAGCRQKGGARLDAVEQLRVKTPAGSPSPLSVAKCGRFGPEDERVNLTHGEGRSYESTAVHAESHSPGPARPRSPKCTMIERLEAAVANVESQELLTYLPMVLAPLPVHQNEQAASARYNNSVPGAHSSSQDVCFESQPCFFGDRHRGHSEAVYQDKSFCTPEGELRDSQRAHEVDLVPQISSKETGVDFRWIDDLNQSARVAGSAHRGPSGAESMACYSLDHPYSVQTISPSREPWPRTAMKDSADASHGQDPSDQLFGRTQNVLPQATEIFPRRSGKQRRLKEYIDQMENEVLCRPQDAADDSSTSAWHSMGDEHGIYGEFARQEHQLNADAYDQDLSGDGHLETATISLAGTNSNAGCIHDRGCLVLLVVSRTAMLTSRL
ncbi:hypothetical protein KVR01_005156 [Diaporthe batatas]|uniref:uncharacterized protein n=1 Tax=Diaporthe batatas TaxID=748121 RepID=UPI001D04439E|nr:uncharacterized protein KVR01_005156 [Diaporthe batatas]KAG8164881.1 hypothetical protein KVR01_005156 [Diaporthe batatas]